MKLVQQASSNQKKYFLGGIWNPQILLQMHSLKQPKIQFLEKYTCLKTVFALRKFVSHC